MLGILGGDPQCPIARSLDILGEKWTLLIVRDALLGSTRFSQFHKSLGIPREVLAARLSSLTQSGVLERTTYRVEGSRPREEYLLTAAGRDLQLVLLALAGWADRHHPAAGGSDLRFVDIMDGGPIEAAAVAAESGELVPPSRIGVRSETLEARKR